MKRVVYEVLFESIVSASRRTTLESPTSETAAALIKLLDTQALSIIEISAYLRIPVGAVRVLVDDLVQAGYLLCDTASTEPSSMQRVDLLKRVLDRMGSPGVHVVEADLPDGDLSRTARLPISTKIVVAGSVDSGKTSLVKTIATEPTQTAPAVLVEEHGTTEVDLHFGRATLDESLRLYLFDANRFSTLWDDFTQGALAAIVLVNPRHLEDSFSAIDYFEHHKVPFVVGINTFTEQDSNYLATAREMIDLPKSIPLTTVDVRSRESVSEFVLLTLRHSLAHADAALFASLQS
jgi:uncharacterized protein